MGRDFKASCSVDKGDDSDVEMQKEIRGSVKAETVIKMGNLHNLGHDR